MNSRNEARHSSLLETKLYCAKHQPVWNADPSFSTDYQTFLDKLIALDSQLDLHLTDSIGFTINKALKEGIIITDLLFIMPRIQTWASPTNNNRPDVKSAATMADSKLYRLADTAILNKANKILGLINANPSIVPSFVTLARKNAFIQHIADFAAIIQMPEIVIDERAVATNLVNDIIRDTMNFRKDILLADSKLFRESHPNFFLGFKQSMKIDNNPTHRLAVRGIVTESDGTTPVPNAFVIIRQTGAKKRTSQNGAFQLKSLAPGQYTAIAVKYGFVTIERTFFVNTGERSEINLKMQRIIISENDGNGSGPILVPTTTGTVPPDGVPVMVQPPSGNNLSTPNAQTDIIAQCTDPAGADVKLVLVFVNQPGDAVTGRPRTVFYPGQTLPRRNIGSMGFVANQFTTLVILNEGNEDGHYSISIFI